MNASQSGSLDESAGATENYGTHLNVTVWSLTGVSAIFLGLRIFAKQKRQRRLWWDDYVLMTGWVRAASLPGTQRSPVTS